MRFHARKTLAILAGAGAAAMILAGCAPDQASSGPAVVATPDTEYLANIGWEPEPGAVPNFACTDDSYARAVTDGINLGIYTAAPYEYMENGKPAGLDWEINMAVLAYVGIEKYETVILQWEGMIPALDSKRIDVITGNIHETPDRLKNIAFTSPAWWYGSSLMISEGNPKNITSWTDLTREDVTVGVVNGSQSMTYLEGIGADFTPYQDANSEFAAGEAGRHDVIVDDGPKQAEYILAHPGSRLIMLQADDMPPADLLANYARYGLRQEDCTLNAAYSRALSELRTHGVIDKILEKYGLEDNMFQPEYKP